MREVVVHGVRIDMPAGVPMLLLREVEGSRGLPIWIGAAEASAIASVLEGATPPRPLTHDLMADVLDALGHSLTAVRITDFEDGTFYAVLDIDGEQVSARPSDAVALALRVGAPIYASEEVLAEVGVEIPAPREEEVEKFREFLDKVSPEDFDAPKDS
jgi:bifunctional DNase/RNase